MSALSKKIVLVLIALLLLYFLFTFLRGDLSSPVAGALSAEVQKGTLEIEVRATGELQAKNSTQITAPGAMRSVGIMRTTISDLVPEGTVVEEGDYVAQLDRAEVSLQIQSAEAEIERIETQLLQLQIDTAIEMQGLRDQLLNQQFVLEERQIQLSQSKYEPQMTIRQAEIDFQRAERDYNQMQARYELKVEQATAKIAEINSLLRQEQIKLNNLRQLSQDFTVRSPGPGMVIYQRTWSGRKGPGSEISAWDLTVAELPDLSEFISRTFVNEIDISKVSPGQTVSMTVDAFPGKEYSGKVIEVANIGQQLRNQDARVFEVNIHLQEADSLLRPAMTTGNRILIDRFEDVLLLPLEAIFRDSLTYVITEVNQQLHRREIIEGAANDIHFIVAGGLEKGQKVLLNYEGDRSELPMIYMDEDEKNEIVQSLRVEKEKREAERRRISREMLEKANKESRQQIQSGGSVFIIN